MADNKAHDRNAAGPGRALRSLRAQKGWTLAEVSARTGLPVSTLSKIENDRMSLTFDKLIRLSEGLGVDLARLLSPSPTAEPEPAPASGRRSINRAGEGKSIETHSYGQLFLATDLLHKRLSPIIAEIRARTIDEFIAEFGGLLRHPGEEFAYVIDGEVELHTELYAPARLKAGDSIYFDSGMGHAYLAVSPGPCRVLSITSTDETQLMELIQREPAPPRRAGQANGSATRGKKAGSRLE